MPALNSLHDCALPFGQDGAIDTIVHAGPADPRLLERYLALWPTRIVWIDDDAERTNALRGLASGTLTCVRAFVGAAAGECTWRRFELAALDGPLPAAPAAGELFPGLPPPQERRVDASALDDLVTTAIAGAAADGRVVLALDHPGRELALFASLRPQTVERLCGVLVRGCARPLLEGGTGFDESLAQFAARGWRRHARSELLPLWPAAALVFDAANQHLVERAADLEAALAESRHQAAVAVRERDEACAQLAGREAALAAALAREAGLRDAAAAGRADSDAREARARRLEDELARVQPRLDEALAIERRLREELLAAARADEALQARAERLVEQLGEVSGAHELALRDKTALVQQRERDAASLDEATRRVAQLAGELAQAAAAREQQSREAVAQAQAHETRARDLARAQDQARQLGEQLAQANAAREVLLREKAALVQQREKHVAALSTAQTQATRMQGAADESAARQRVLAQALAKAEGQLAVLRELLLRD